MAENVESLIIYLHCYAMYLMQHAPENETRFKNCGLYKVLKNEFVQRE